MKRIYFILILILFSTIIVYPVRLRIVSFPRNAEVIIDNKSTGISPVIVDLTPGMHQIKLIKNGFEPYKTEVQVSNPETMYVFLKADPIFWKLFNIPVRIVQYRLVGIPAKILPEKKSDAQKYLIDKLKSYNIRSFEMDISEYDVRKLIDNHDLSILEKIKKKYPDSEYVILGYFLWSETTTGKTVKARVELWIYNLKENKINSFSGEESGAFRSFELALERTMKKVLWKVVNLVVQDTVKKRNARILVNEINTDKFPEIKIDFYVRDSKTGNYISSLIKSDFRLIEGERNAEFNLKKYLNRDYYNLLLLDFSASMFEESSLTKRIVSKLFEIIPGKYCLVIIGGNKGNKYYSIYPPNSEFIENTELIRKKIAELENSGITPLYNAIYESINILNGKNGLKNLIVITDAKDETEKSLIQPSERKNLNDIKAKLKQDKINLIMIGVGRDINMKTLESISSLSGRTPVIIRDEFDLSELDFLNLSQDVKYSINFTSDDAKTVYLIINNHYFGYKIIDLHRDFLIACIEIFMELYISGYEEKAFEILKNLENILLRMEKQGLNLPEMQIGNAILAVVLKQDYDKAHEYLENVDLEKLGDVFPSELRIVLYIIKSGIHDEFFINYPSKIINDVLKLLCFFKYPNIIYDIARKTPVEMRKIITFPREFEFLNLIFLGKLKDALKEINDLLKTNPDNPELLFWKSTVYIELGKIAEALKIINDVLEVYPNNVEILKCKLNIYIKLGDLNEALKVANKILEIEPGDLDTIICKVNIYRNMGKLEEALKFIDDTLKKYPEFLNLHELKIDVCIELDKISDAIKLAKELLEIEPGNLDLWAKIIELYIRIGNLNKALEYTDEYLDKCGKNPEILRLKARILQELGKLDQVLQLLEEIMDLCPDDPSIRMLYEKIKTGKISETLKRQDKHPPCIILKNIGKYLNTYTRSSKIKLNLIIRDDGVVDSVTINGRMIPIEFGYKRVHISEILNLKHGKNIFIIKASDLTGKTSERTIQIFRDTSSPKIYVNDLVFTNSPNYKFHTKIVDDGIIRMVKINEKTFRAYTTSYEFDYIVDLRKSKNNTINIIAEDIVGNVSRKTAKIILDTHPPVIDIKEPTTTLVFDDVINLIFTVYDDNSIKSIRVNSNKLTISQTNNYTIPLKLSEGDNLIFIVAEDSAGNISKRTLKIRFERLKPPRNLKQAVCVDCNDIVLKWENTETDCNIEIWRSIKDKDKWEKIAVLSPNKTEFVDRKAYKGVHNVYKIRYVKNNRFSKWSNIIETNRKPEKPVLLFPKNGDYYVSPDTPLIWKCEDPDGDQLKYDVYLSPSEANPITAGIIMDYSGSMEINDIRSVEHAVKKFVELLTMKDLGFIVKFSEDIFSYPQNGFTDKNELVYFVYANNPPRAGTALYDSIYLSLERLKNDATNNTKVILAFTDGKDNKSTHKVEDCIELAREIGSKIYTIGYGEIDENVLENISKKTNGKFYKAPSPSVFEAIYAELAGEVRLRKIASDLMETKYYIDNLEENKKYYWKIVAKDEKGAFNDSKIWEFRTPEKPHLELEYPRKNRYATNNKVLTIKGRAKNANYMVLYLNNIPRKIPIKNNQFEYNLILCSGKNTVKLELKNTAGSVIKILEITYHGANEAIWTELTWDKDKADIDLYFCEPDGEFVWYSDMKKHGELDRDDTDGYGPEHYTLLSKDAIPGIYKIWVHYYSNNGQTEPVKCRIVVKKYGEVIIDKFFILTISNSSNANPKNANYNEEDWYYIGSIELK